MSAGPIAKSRRLVIKVGSALLVDDSGELNRRWLDTLADDVAELKLAGTDVLIVSSGAIAIGRRVIRINKRRARLDELQAAAAAGQVALVHAYQESLARHSLVAAQVLLTPDDTEHRRRFLNARGTLGKLLDCGVVPVINENDTVATEEIRYGDNDRLAARVAQMVMADVLVLLSDVDGLYTADPSRDPAARHIAEVNSVSDEIIAMAGSTRSDVGTGGMATKVLAAKIATHAGCATLVTSGAIEHPLRALQDGARCSIFHASATPKAARKQWLAGALEVNGELRLDDGAVQALHDGSSLLPVGVVAVAGTFQRGDIVRLTNTSGAEIGRGLAEYSDAEALQLAGTRSENIEEILGYAGRSVVVHRDDLVLLDDD